MVARLLLEIAARLWLEMATMIRDDCRMVTSHGGWTVIG